MTVQHLFPDLDSVQYESTFEVGPGVDLATFHAFAYRDLDVETEATGFTFSVGMNANFTFNNVEGNALRLIDSDDMFSPIQSVSLVDTNIVGFDASRITFTDDFVTLRFAGLSVNTASNVSIRATTENVSPIPEPSSYILILIGFSLVMMKHQFRRFGWGAGGH